MNIIEENWQEILAMVKEEHDVSDISFKTWLQPLRIYNIDEENKIITLMVPSMQIGVNYVNRKFNFPIKVAIAEFTGTEYSIEFILPENSRADSTAEDTNGRLNAAMERANLNPKYTFDTFVVGSNNKFAHAASLAVAESPGKMYNPLFIYGGAGLGKTHLMHSIAHFILEQDPEKKVLYVTSETFTNELIEAIRHGESSGKSSLISSFREKYRSVDVLLIDDIQFISGKEATQEEFFHTFNELHSNNKQIIITSDKPPKDIETLEARLSSRFEWGILADVSVPDFETRMAILRKKEESEGYDIDDQVIQYIANNIKSNIRELEGALNKLIAYSRLERNHPINIELAEKAIRDIVAPEKNREITPQLILDTVADHFNLSPADLAGNKRSSEIVVPRQIFMYLCREMIDIPYKSIGSLIGKDHSTVMHGYNRIVEDMEQSESLRATVDVIRKKINPNI